MIDQQKQSVIYNIISKSIIKSTTRYLTINNEYIESKSKQLCYCNNQSYKESIINNIYLCLEHDITLTDLNHLLNILLNLKKYSMYVCNITEFWRLYNSLYRFTHCVSFFNTCMPTIVATLATLITMVMTNKLLYAAEMVESIETYLFLSQKHPSQELADLLDMKYGLINLVQYKIFPIMIGSKELLPNQSMQLFSAGSNSSDYSSEVNKIMELPVKTDSIINVYNFLSDKGINTSNNYAEYVAGIKIEEITNTDVTTCNEMQQQDVIKKPLRATIQPLTIQEQNAMKALDVLNIAEKKHKGHILDGRITSPITNTNSVADLIPFTASDMEKFAVLEYLYIMRIMANNIKKKNNSDNRIQGITLNINSPFKSITVPGLNSVK
ncbi:Virion core protein [Swinepox virus]|uniref:Assembly protein G7 n=1 Tax=Swinepox virus TaxID=10276 RepID=A0A881SY13_SWPV|nr:Virion core protein [Swinepox virus]